MKPSIQQDMGTSKEGNPQQIVNIQHYHSPCGEIIYALC